MPQLNDADRAHVLNDATAQFWHHIVSVVKVAFAIHIVLFAAFVVLGCAPMVIANAVSLLMYIVCLRGIAKGRYQLAGVMMSTEIIGHALAAIWFLGWNSNFHFYLFCVVPVISFSFQTAPARRVGLGLAILSVVVGGFALRGHMGAQSGISEEVLETIGVVNAFTATALLLQASALAVRFTLKMQLSLYHAAHRDILTDLYTRRRILQRVGQLERSPYRPDMALVLLDIDHFKQINDRHGHELGDDILQRVARAISDSVRASDMAARWGGEEFLVLMPDTRLADAEQVAGRILQRIREAGGTVTDQPIAVTATVAVAQLDAGEVFKDALNRADQALYEGKRAGRDRVMLAPLMALPA